MDASISSFSSFDQLLHEYAQSIEPLPLDCDVVLHNLSNDDIEQSVDDLQCNSASAEETSLASLVTTPNDQVCNFSFEFSDLKAQNTFMEDLFTEGKLKQITDSSCCENVTTEINTSKGPKHSIQKKLQDILHQESIDSNSNLHQSESSEEQELEKAFGKLSIIEHSTTNLPNEKGTSASLFSQRKKPVDIDITSLNSFDVLFVRGSIAKNNKGNIFYRDQISENRVLYSNGDKRTKTYLTWKVVFNVKQNGGRFYEYDKSTMVGSNKLVEVSDVLARRRVSQAFRDLNRIKIKVSKK